MSELDDPTLQQLRTRLAEREAELIREVRAVTQEQNESPTRIPRNQVEDEGEQGEQRLHEAVRHAERERDVLELREITAAQARMAAGEYGSCVDCGLDIPLDRLLAQPWAARCVPCQEKHERQQPPQPRIRPTL